MENIERLNQLHSQVREVYDSLRSVLFTAVDMGQNPTGKADHKTAFDRLSRLYNSLSPFQADEKITHDLFARDQPVKIELKRRDNADVIDMQPKLYNSPTILGTSYHDCVIRFACKVYGSLQILKQVEHIDEEGKKQTVSEYSYLFEKDDISIVEGKLCNSKTICIGPSKRIHFSLVPFTPTVWDELYDRYQSSLKLLAFDDLFSPSPGKMSIDIDHEFSITTSRYNNSNNTVKKRRITTKDEANIKVRDYLARNVKKGTPHIKRDDIAAELGIGCGTVSETPAWIVYVENRKSKNKGKIRQVSLDEGLLATLPSPQQNANEQLEAGLDNLQLSEVIAEQVKDEIRDRHSSKSGAVMTAKKKKTHRKHR
ncbi:MAG: hypothetical protein U0798_17565 [Gemmataceae bacterium]